MNPIKENIQKSYLIIAIMSWVALLFFDNFTFFGFQPFEHVIYQFVLRMLLLSILSISVFLFYKITIGSFEGQGFDDLLWKSFITNSIVMFFVLALELIRQLVFSQLSWLPPTFSYHVMVALTFIYSFVNLFTFKKLILYQKSKQIDKIWLIFEYCILGSIAFNFVNFNSTNIVFNLICAILLLLSVVLSINLKWIAYLNFKQKIQYIGYFSSVLIYDLAFIWILLSYSAELKPITDLSNNIQEVSLIGFIGIYSGFSVLVLLFHLPTSSIFEQKFSEIVNLQKFSNSAGKDKNENEMLAVLLDSCCSTFMINSAAIELYNEKNQMINFQHTKLDKEFLFEIKTFIRKNGLSRETDSLLVDKIGAKKHGKIIQNQGVKSILCLPIESMAGKLGTIYMLSELNNGFEKEMIEIAKTYISQTAIAITNFRLVTQAVSNARYKEELEIAHRVQDSLLPKSILGNEMVNVFAISESTDQVGGDYFDFAWIDQERLALVIGDVSGKGTSAAFHMALLKGVFHSLIHASSTTAEFLILSNKALSACLEKNSFVTLSILMIDLKSKELCISRAGHCPALFYNHLKEEYFYIEQKGMGLAILRDSDRYNQFISTETISFSAGDKLMLFTDGYVEAKDKNGNEFGYEFAKKFFIQNSHLPELEFKKEFHNNLDHFTDRSTINDDYTALFVNFL